MTSNTKDDWDKYRDTMPVVAGIGISKHGVTETIDLTQDSAGSNLSIESDKENNNEVSNAKLYIHIYIFSHHVILQYYFAFTSYIERFSRGKPKGIH